MTRTYGRGPALKLLAHPALTWLGAMIDAAPLGVFLLLMARLPPLALRVRDDWRAPYDVATIVFVLVLLLRWRWSKALLDRIHLAIGLYFVSGSVGLFAHVQWLNDAYGRLEATAMFVWIVVVGAAFALISPAGFIGIEGDPTRARAQSWLLLATAVALSALSAASLGNRLLSAYVPFVLLFSARAVLQRRRATV